MDDSISQQGNDSLARRLASGNKKTRAKTIASLSKWLKAHKDVSEMDYLKLWKALFFCFWLSDKVPVQQELAKTMAKFMHTLPSSELTLMFVKTFFTTMKREWLKLDRYRTDKFMSLMRYMLRESLEFLHKRGWPESLCEKFNSMWLEDVLLCEPEGVRIHIAEIFLEELLQVDADIDSVSALVILQPFIRAAAHRQSGRVVPVRVCAEVLQPLLYTSIGSKMASAGVGMNDEEREEERNQIEAKRDLMNPHKDWKKMYADQGPTADKMQAGIEKLAEDQAFVNLDLTAIQEEILKFARAKDVPSALRARLYTMAKEFEISVSGYRSAIGQGDDDLDDILADIDTLETRTAEASAAISKGDECEIEESDDDEEEEEEEEEEESGSDDVKDDDDDSDASSEPGDMDDVFAAALAARMKQAQAAGQAMEADSDDDDEASTAEESDDDAAVPEAEVVVVRKKNAGFTPGPGKKSMSRLSDKKQKRKRDETDQKSIHTIEDAVAAVQAEAAREIAGAVLSTPKKQKKGKGAATEATAGSASHTPVVASNGKSSNKKTATIAIDTAVTVTDAAPGGDVETPSGKKRVRINLRGSQVFQYHPQKAPARPNGASNASVGSESGSDSEGLRGVLKNKGEKIAVAKGLMRKIISRDQQAGNGQHGRKGGMNKHGHKAALKALKRKKKK